MLDFSITSVGLWRPWKTAHKLSSRLRLTEVCSYSPCEKSLLLSSWLRRRKWCFTLIASSFWSRRILNFWVSQSCSLSSNWLFEPASVYWSVYGHNWSRCANHTAIRPGLACVARTLEITGIRKKGARERVTRPVLSRILLPSAFYAFQACAETFIVATRSTCPAKILLSSCILSSVHLNGAKQKRKALRAE